MNRGADEGTGGPSAGVRSEPAASTASGPTAAAKARDRGSTAPWRMLWGCRPEIDSRTRPHVCAHPPLGSVSQAGGQQEGGAPGGANTSGTRKGALSVMHPGSRQSPLPASQGNPRDKTANATTSRRAPTGDFQNRLADIVANVWSRQGPVKHTPRADSRPPDKNGVDFCTGWLPARAGTTSGQDHSSLPWT